MEFQFRNRSFCLALCAATGCLLAVRPAAAEAPRIVMLGDSITKGVRAGVAEEQTFASLIAARLHEDGQEAEVINAGIGGERTDQALLRLAQDVLSPRPAIVVVMYGTNDSYVDQGVTACRITREEYADNLRELVRAIRAAGARPILMTEPRWGAAAEANGVGEHPNVRLEPYMDACREVARETETPLVDHFARWTEAETAGQDLGDWTTDQCHPNPRGHEELAELMWAPVRDELARAEEAGDSSRGQIEPRHR